MFPLANNVRNYDNVGKLNNKADRDSKIIFDQYSDGMQVKIWRPNKHFMDRDISLCIFGKYDN